MPNTPLAQIPYPDGTTKVADWDDALLTALLAAEKKLANTFTTGPARDAVITVPAAGMLAYLSTPKWLTQHDGSGWVVVYSLDRIGATATRASALSCAPGATDVTWTAEAEDTDGLITPTSAIFTVPAGLGGRWSISATLSFAAAVTGGYLRFVAGGGNWQTMAGNFGDISHSVEVRLNAGDTVKALIWNGGGGAVNLNTGRIEVYRVGP